jgi:uncharacterized membrane protein YkoI
MPVMRHILLLAAFAGLASAPPAGAQDRHRDHGDDRHGDHGERRHDHQRDREQDTAFRETRDGRMMPLRSIEGRIMPRMGGAQYLGPEFDPGAGVYRLKFMRDGRVIWVDVDARTGTVVGRSRD